MNPRWLVYAQTFLQWFTVKVQPILRRFDWELVRTSGFVLILSFVVASSVSTFAANIAMNTVTAKGARRASQQFDETAQPGGVGFGVVPKVDLTGAGQWKKTVLERNLFNSDGVLPPDGEDGAGRSRKTENLDFSKVECVQEKLPIEIVGTIVTSDPKQSVVVAKDPKVPTSDTYKAGDLIIGFEEYEIYAVQRGSVEVRKGDQKICVELKGFEQSKGTTAAAAQAAPGAVAPENVELIEFDANYMSEQYKNGGQPILECAKMIPDVEPGSGKVLGFKLISIKPGCIFDQMKLGNGDIVQEVNGISLRDPARGYELYRALQEEREITIGILRNGEPMTRKVRVK